MKLFRLAILVTLFLSSCAAQKKTLYMQNIDYNNPEQIAQNFQIKIKPFDRLSVLVSSKNPELSAPFNKTSAISSSSSSSTGASASSGGQILSVDQSGNITIPVLGEVKASGLSREELARDIEKRLIEGGFITDPTVNTEFVDMKITILGEVSAPGYFDVKSDRLSILDAFAMAGDLTIFGQREDVTIIREENGERVAGTINLTDAALFDSPYFYLQQNDMIYVKPNKNKAQTGQISQNRAFYLSLVGTLISVATLIVTLSR